MIHLLLFRSLALGSTIAKISIPTYATISRYANTRGHSKLLLVTLHSTKLVLILILQKMQFSVRLYCNSWYLFLIIFNTST